MTLPVRRPPLWRADLALAIVCLIWGTTFIIVKEAVADMPVLLFLAVRFSMAAGVLALVFGLRRNRPPIAPSLKGGIIAGLFLFSGYVLQTFGLSHTTASKAGFITGLYIPLVPIFGALVYRKTPQISEVAGIVLAFIGTALMTIQKDILSVNPGDLLVAGCAVVYAFHILVLGRFSKTGDVGWLATIQIATGAAMGWIMWGISSLWGHPQVAWTRTVWVGLLVTSLLATAFGFSAQTWAQKYTTATRTALIFSLEPVFAWVASFIAAGEMLTPRGLAGAALILSGIVLVELKPFRWISQQRLSDESV